MSANILPSCRCMLMFQVGENEKWKMLRGGKFVVSRYICSSGPNLVRKIDN